jgi:hypothetical protein
MPFTPLPEIFSADLAACADPVLADSPEILELGSGDGAFTAVLRGLGVEPLTVDRASAISGARARIRGDALAPPVRRRFTVVVAANLLRHLWREVADSGPVVWRDLVSPGGSLWILEDEPLAAPAAARHYRDLQGLLARLDPAHRGPLLARRRFDARRRRWAWGGAWTAGEAVNLWPAAADQDADWLSAGVTEPGGEVARLAAAVRRDGLDYGRYWWARWQAEETS